MVVCLESGSDVVQISFNAVLTFTNGVLPQFHSLRLSHSQPFLKSSTITIKSFLYSEVL